MYSIYLVAAIGIVIGLIVAPRGWSKLGGFAIGGIIGGVVGLIVSMVVSEFVPEREVVYGPATLVSMRSSDGLSGTFIWGSGSVGNRTTYNFMMKLEDDSLTPGSVDANSLVRIKEDSTLTNVGYWTQTRLEPDTTSEVYKWALVVGSGRIIREEFRVPVGTVVQTFKVQ